MYIDEIRKSVSELENIGQQLDDDTNLSVYGLDSLKRVELVIILEDKFGINFHDSDLTQSNFETINSIGKLLQKYGVNNG